MRGMALGNVAELRGGAVAADVTDAGRAEPRNTQRLAHGHFHGLGGGLCHMACVAVRAEADDLAEDLGAARFRGIPVLEHERCRPFADHEPVAIPIPRPRRSLWRVVLLAGGEQRVEHRRLRDRQLLGTPRHHEALRSVLHGLVRVADGLTARSARRARCDEPAADVEEQARVHRGRVAHHADVARRVDQPRAAFVHHRTEIGDGVGAARRRAKRDPALAVGQHVGFEQTRVGKRALRGHDREACHSAHATNLLPRISLRHREIGDRRAEPRVEPVVVGPLFHPPDSAAALAHLGDHRRVVAAERGEAGHARDGHARRHESPPSIEMT